MSAIAPIRQPAEKSDGGPTIMTFDIITIFPHLFDSFLNESLIKKSVQKKLNKICVHDLRRWAKGKHRQVDDRPYGGGPGMILMVEPILRALKSLKAKKGQKKTKIILLSPAGKEFNQKMAQKLSGYDRLILICGRYEGVDARVEKIIDKKISIGPYVLSGGELAAMVMVETISRLRPGYLGNPNSLQEETFLFSQNKKEYPQYTRPETMVIQGKKYHVPKILLSGNHQKIKEWRKKNC